MLVAAPPVFFTCQLTSVAWLEFAPVGGVTAVTWRFGNGDRRMSIGRSSIAVLLSSRACSKTSLFPSVWTTTQKWPLKIVGRAMFCVRVTDSPAAMVPVSVNDPKYWSPPMTSSFDNQTLSVHEPLASAVPWLVSVQESGIAWPESASTGAPMALTTRSGNGGSVSVIACARVLFASLDSGWWAKLSACAMM